MVEGGLPPVHFVVAKAAVTPKPACVRVIACMAAATILGCSLQGVQGTRTLVAACAICFRVFGKQRETCTVVVEISAIGINPVVASQAVLPKSLHVRLDKSCLQVNVAGSAS